MVRSFELFSGLSPVQLRSFSGPETGLTNTNFVHDAQNYSRLQQLYAARSCRLKRIKGRYRGNEILASLIDRPIFTYQYSKKAGKKMVSVIGSDEKAAFDLAFHTVILFELEISANPPPSHGAERQG